MQRRSQIFICVLIILLISSSLCFGDDDKDGTQYQKEWWDLSKFKEFLELDFEVQYKEESGSKIIQEITNPKETLYIAVGIDEPFTELENEALLNFVESGGMLIVAGDNYTNVNPLADRFGIDFNKHAIIYKFEDFDYNYTFLPIEAKTANNTFNILVHSPLGIDILREDYLILGESISTPNRVLSVLDINDNREIDGGDKPGPIPIMVEVTEGKGKAVFISDAGLFTDHLWKVESLDEDFPGRIYQNNEFVVDLVHSMNQNNGKIVFDISKQTEGFSNFHPYPKEK